MLRKHIQSDRNYDFHFSAAETFLGDFPVAILSLLFLTAEG